MEIGQADAGRERGASAGRLEGASHLDNGDFSAKMSPASAADQNGSNDVASDISMSSDSDSDESDDSDPAEPATEPEAQPAHDEPEIIQDGINGASKKRKSPGGDSQGSEAGEPSTSETHKKARLDNGSEQSSVSKGLVRDKSLLAPEVWHHIFTFCPPKTLGNLLRVNKLFHQYLSPSTAAQIDTPPSAPRGVLRVLKPNNIWLKSRRLFWPHMPAPLRSMSELSMWRLLCSTKCQECGKSDARDSELPADNVHNGPGLEGVSLLWPFGIRVCGPCLLGKAIKEIDVLLSSTVPSTLIPALPFVHITKELHVVSLTTIEQGQLPANVQVTKLFLASDIHEIKQEFISVKALGSGTMEEWLKGLEPRGQSRLNEFRKWEKWANTGSLQQIRHVPDPSVINGAVASQTTTATTVSKTVDHHQTTAHVRHERTLGEVSELKAARRAEIERRAFLLDPPLTPNVLRHMITFQAATQLITALDDNAWDLLKPRLLAERSEAEEIENKVSAQIRMIQGQNNNSHLEATLATTKEAKDAIDRDWEEVQAPLRARIVRYADEFIRDSWDKGKKVKQDNCSKFAAEALIYIRKRFYAQVAKDAEAGMAAGKEPVIDPPEGPFTQKLTLENMRWIFDTKIKPLTVPFRKEVFFCNGCAAKPFGFEGVVQHYAAKHTDMLSCGNIVVHWRTEWPEEPPFNPEGRIKVIYPVPGPTPYPPGVGSLPAYPLNNYAPPPGSGAPPPGQPFAPGPSYGASPYGEQQYPNQYPGYPPNFTYAPAASALPNQPYAPHPGWGPYQNGPTPNGPYPHNPTPPQVGGYQQPMAPAPVPVPPPSTVPGPYNHGPNVFPTIGAPGYPPSRAPYLTQLEDIVRNSREIWNATANIRDLPGSARIFVTIHHVVKRFRARFSETPALAIFQDGLSNHKDMRPVRNINTLACKACQLGLGNAPYIQEERKSFSLPQLVNHFQSKHIEAMQKEMPDSPPLDWTADMVLLPGPGVLAKLRSAVGSDGFKYKLFSEAFPEVFGQPPATVPYYGQHIQQPQTYQPGSQFPAAALPPAVDNHERFYTQQQGPQQTQGQQVPEAQTPYQPQPDYMQGAQANTFVPHPSQAPAYQPEQAPHNPVVASVADYDIPGREENSSRSSQGSRPRPQQNAKWTRKERKKHAQNSHSGQNKHSGPNVKIKDEEPRLPEEEKAREEELRAMWANDRAATARVFRASVKPETEQPSQVAPKMNQGQPQALARENRSDLEQEPRGPHQQRNDRPPREELSLLDALEMHLDQDRRLAPQSQPQPRDQAGATYMDGRGTVAGEAIRRQPEQYAGPPTSGGRPVSPIAPYYQRAREQYPELQHRAPEPRQYGNHYPQECGPEELGYKPRNQAPLPAQHDDAPQLRRPGTHQPYDHGHRPEEQVIYERPPPQERTSQDYRHRSYYPEDLVPPPPRGPPTGQLYEIVEVIDAQGSYFIRRPIGRAPPPEPAAYYDYPYEPEQPRELQPPIGTGRAGPEPYPPRLSGDEGYSRPPAHPAGDDGYSRPPPHQAPPSQHQREEYPLPLTSARAWGGDYPPHQYQRSASRPEVPARGGYDEEEEYDPRYPAAPPPGNTEYQRRQVRYE